MSHISQFLPKNYNETKDLCFNMQNEHFLTTDTFKVGDKVYIRDAEDQEIWEICKFISHHPSKKPAVILLLDEKEICDSNDIQLQFAPSSVCAFLDQLILI
jgi:hypothetical protein